MVLIELGEAQPRLVVRVEFLIRVKARIVQTSPMDTTSVATEFQTDYRWVSTPRHGRVPVQLTLLLFCSEQL